MLKRCFVLMLALLTLMLLPAAAVGTRDAIIDNRGEGSDRAELTDLLPDGMESDAPSSAQARSGDSLPDGSGMAGESSLSESSTSRTVTGIILSVIVALAIIVLILILVPKSRKNS